MLIELFEENYRNFDENRKTSTT